MADFDLGKQIGPLPLGGWIAVVAGGLLIGYYFQRNMAAPREVSPVQLTESDVGTGGGQFIYDPPQEQTPDTVPETNQSWGRKAVNWLIAQNHDPNVADNTIRRYLAGLPLDAAGKAMIALVLPVLGLPPEQLPVVEDPGTEEPSRAAPSAVTGLYVGRAKLRNMVTWHHDNANVVGFVVVATNLKTKKQTKQVVAAHPTGSGNRYIYNHFGDPRWTFATRPRFQYYVRPFNGSQANPVWGPGAAVTATHALI